MSIRKQLRQVKFLKSNYRHFRSFVESISDNLQIPKCKLLKKPYIISHYARVINFGDLFNHDLMQYFGLKLIYTPNYLKSEMTLTGSILHLYQSDYKGKVMGSGFIRKDYNKPINFWDIRIIRGPLSAVQCNANDNSIYGDPGVLASVLYPLEQEKEYRLGIVPHCVDFKFVSSLNFPRSVKIINARRSAKEVALDIQKCEHIVSSSLHGLIFADAYQIPNIHVKFGDKLIGGLHKFEDYYLGMNAEYEGIQYNGETELDLISKCRNRFTKEYLKNKQQDIISVFKEVLSAKLK